MSSVGAVEGSVAGVGLVVGGTVGSVAGGGVVVGGTVGSVAGVGVVVGGMVGSVVGVGFVEGGTVGSVVGGGLVVGGTVGSVAGGGSVVGGTVGSVVGAGSVTVGSAAGGVDAVASGGRVEGWLWESAHPDRQQPSTKSMHSSRFIRKFTEMTLLSCEIQRIILLNYSISLPETEVKFFEISIAINRRNLYNESTKMSEKEDHP